MLTVLGYLWEKYQMNSSKRSNNSFRKKKRENFYQIRFTIWILKTFAVLITFFSPTVCDVKCHTWNKFILTRGHRSWGGGRQKRYRNIILTLFPFRVLTQLKQNKIGEYFFIWGCVREWRLSGIFNHSSTR